MPRAALGAIVALTLFLSTAPAAFAADAPDAKAPPPLYRVPLMKQPPKIDGKIEPAEWAVAAGFEGVQYDGRLQQRRAQAFVGADETHLYVAMKTMLPTEGTLAAAVDTDSLKAVFDDAIEVFVCPTPETPKQVDYQFLVNSRGKGGYQVHLLGGAEENMAWTGNWREAHGFHDGYWHFECAIPIESMSQVARGRKTTDGQWRINLTRDWKDPWEWSTLSGEGGGYAFNGYRFVFVAGGAAPAVAYASAADPFVKGFEGALALHNPGAAPMELAATLALDRNNMPPLKEERKMTLVAGATQKVTLAVPPDDPTTHYGLRALVTSADGQTVFYDRKTAWTRAPAYRWIAGARKKAEELSFRFAYYPYSGRMRIVADIAGLKAGAQLKRLTAEVRKADSKKRVKQVEFPVDQFKDGRQEQAVDLPALDGAYEIALRAEGKNVPEGEIVQAFDRKRFPWEHTKLGTSTKVYPPFTPIEVKGMTLRTVLREHALNDLGLLDQVVATSAETKVSKPVLAAPMRYVVKVDGKEEAVKARGLKFLAKKPHEVRTESSFTAGALACTSEVTWDYDGTARVDLTLKPTGGKEVQELVLEIPFSDESAPLIHANADRIRAPVAQKLPAGEGVVWKASAVACDDYLKNFCPYLYLGSPVRGLCWFAENDRGWSWDRATPNVTVVRQGRQVVLRVHLINKPLVIETPRTITFGLLAAPVKPRLLVDGPASWRYRFMRDRYQLLGTDINWLSLGTCGSVYPVGQDMYFWEMIARGSREKIPEEVVKQVVERGRKYFEPYGPDEVRTWEAHVRHNLSCHLGARMVFYYNRASHQAAEEFQTFEDEWALTDLRSVGKGNGKWEIKIVPSASYIDHALYWYAKSFEIGANQGVYWDNWFIAPSSNTVMADAYREPDGRIVPGAGIWQHRELAKRTFVMMNERGMRPITFPHMTSFNPLPMMAFATVQYDWEWQYSMGDAQDRFTRELILLMTTGDLAGAWPVPLSDAGKLAEDPWTQRTFTAVRLVHELDGYGGFGIDWSKVHKENTKVAQPILDLLDQPGLVVYRYWDERPQPVTTGNPDVPTIVYSVPGREAVVAVVGYAKQDELVTLKIDSKALGFAAGCTVTDVETEQPVGAFTLKKHDVKVLRIGAGAAR